PPVDYPDSPSSESIFSVECHVSNVDCKFSRQRLSNSNSFLAFCSCFAWSNSTASFSPSEISEQSQPRCTRCQNSSWRLEKNTSCSPTRNVLIPPRHSAKSFFHCERGSTRRKNSVQSSDGAEERLVSLATFCSAIACICL